MREQIMKFITVLQRFSSFEGSLFRYSLSYSFLLALFPTLIIIVLLFHNSLLDVEMLFDYLYRFLPQSFLEPFIEFLMDKNYNGISIAVSSITGFYFASRSVYSFMLIGAKDENFNVPKILIRIKSYVLFVVIVISVTILSLLSSIFQYSPIITFSIGLFLMFMILYRTLVFEKKPWSYGIVGSIFSTVAIILYARLFFQIIEYFTSYNSLYGPMASLLIMMLSIYILSSIIFFGYCINYVYGSRYSYRVYKNEWYYNGGKKLIEKAKQVVKKKIK